VDLCKREYTEEDLGCSIVSIIDVETLALKKLYGFHDYHLDFCHPWRVIVCCIRKASKRTFTLKQVEKATKQYTALGGNDNVLNFITKPNQDGNLKNDSNTFQSNSPADNNANTIIDFAESVNWEPDITMVIRNTTSLP
jgi:hypothetical protein